MTEREPVTLIQGIRAHPWLVLASGLLMASLAAALAWVTTPAATVSGTLGLVSPAAGNVLLPLPTSDATIARYTAQRALFATSDEVLSKAVDLIGDTTLEGLRGAVTVAPSKNASAIVFTANAGTVARAVLINQSLMEAYRSATLKDVTARTKASAAAWRAAGDTSQAKQITIEGESFGDGVEFQVTPNAASASERTPLGKESILGLLLGLAGGSLLAWAREDARRRRELEMDVIGDPVAEARDLLDQRR